MKILIIDDDPVVVDLVSVTLKMRWPDAKLVGLSRGEDGIKAVETEAPDAVIMDIGLPDISGFEAIKRIRLFSDIPILILSGNNDESAIVKGLEWGADDYIIKPFKHMELLARLKCILKRQQRHEEEDLICGKLRFEPVSNRVWSGQKAIKISHMEGLILAHLMRNCGKVVTYSSLSSAMWGDIFPEAHDSIRVHIRHLREKIEETSAHPLLILNESGVGYLLTKSDHGTPDNMPGHRLDEHGASGGSLSSGQQNDFTI